MPLITLTTDFGMRAYYAAAIKGAVISQCEQFVPIVDISHTVKPFDIREAAFVIANSYRFFPKGTIHIVHVNATAGSNKILLAVVDGHYFITFDTGLLALAFGTMPPETYQINEELLAGSSLLYEVAIGKAVNLLVQEYRPADFGRLATGAKDLRLLQAIPSDGRIRGMISYVDGYGNGITNISQQMIEEYIGNRPFTVALSKDSVNTISNTYDDVEEGEMVCLYNSAGWLEIAISHGSAEHLLGLKYESSVLVSVG